MSQVRAPNLFSTLIVCAIATASLISQKSVAAEEGTFEDAMDVLEAQIAKLSNEPGQSCPREHKSLYSSNNIRISLFYGYGNFEKVTIDQLQSKAMTAMLMRKSCAPNVEACAFKAVERTAHSTKLRKSVRGKTVEILIVNASFSDQDGVNMDPKKGFWDQEKLSREVTAKFHEELVQSDVVVYAGHSRGGNGPSFEGQTAAQLAFNYFFKLPLRPMVQALAQKPSRLKMLAMMSCQSEKYYRAPIEQANPGISLVLTKTDVDASDAEQSTIGLINSLLTQKCSRDLKRALIPEGSSETSAMLFIRKQ